MPLRSILWIIGYYVAVFGALSKPILGAFGYMSEYILAPGKKWWYFPVRGLTYRMSFTLAFFTALGMFVHRDRLRYGTRFLNRYEKAVLAFVAVAWVSVLISDGLMWHSYHDPPHVKLTKVVIFTLMLSHIITNPKYMNYLMWAITILAFDLGWEAYNTPLRQFNKGRIENVGSADLSEANVLAAFCAAMLPIIAVQFLRSKWIGKILTALAGAFVANAFILCRSRGGLIGVTIGAALAVALSPKKHRLKIAVGLLVAFLGGLSLADPGFMRRMAKTNLSNPEEDASARNRINTWRGTVNMVMANPLGVGSGNFLRSIAQYAPDNCARDAHSTFFRCLGEMGFPGVISFAVILVYAAKVLRWSMKEARKFPQPLQNQILYTAYGISVSIVTFLGCGLTTTTLYTEGMWWILILPSCLERTIVNASADVRLEPAQEASAARPRPAFRPPRRPRRSAAGART